MPTKNQTFKTIPDLNTVQLVLDAFGLENLDDTRPFDKEHMKDFHTVEKLNDLSDTLKDYYLPCKNKYLYDLNEKKCMTILRQFIRIHKYTICTKEKSMNGKKYTTWRLMYNNTKELNNHNMNSEFLVNFD